MVTKAVSDQLATSHGGIADQMIRFNGLPCFEKEDQAYGAAIGSVMTGGAGIVRVIGEDGFAASIDESASGRDVFALPPRIPLNVLESRCLSSREKGQSFSGWPIVKGRRDLRIVGYVGRAELQSAIGAIVSGARSLSCCAQG